MVPKFEPKTRLSASQLNALSNAISNVQTRVAALEGGGGLRYGQSEPAIRVRVRDEAGAGLERHQIVKLGGQAYTDDDQIYDRVINVNAPDDETAGRWGIMVDGVDPEGVGYSGSGVAGKGLGYAYVSGIAFAYCDITDTTHEYAEAVDGETMLASATIGTARIIGRETEDTGEQWVIIQWPVGGGGGGGDTRWVSVTADSISDDEIVVIEDDVSMQPGTPIRWDEATGSEDPDYRYGVITSATQTAGSPAYTTYTYAGPPMTNYAPMWRDQYQLSTMVHLFVSGEYANATGSDILWTLRSVRFKWLGATHYLVQMQACQGTDATTTQPVINISIDDTAVTDDGVQLVTSTFVTNDANDILTAGYQANYGDIVKIAVTTAAVGATKAKDLTVELLFVSE